MADEQRINIGDCVLIDGSMTIYQRRARAMFSIHTDNDLSPWAWITTICGKQCINPLHMTVHTPVKIKYPAGVCIYCGFPSGSRDHLIPRGLSGDAARSSIVAVVPACSECNSRIQAAATFNVSKRREIAHESIRKSKRHILSAPDWTDEDLAEFGYELRSHIKARRSQKQATLSRLSWPEDPLYDMKAFQRSGIEDPFILDLCDNPYSQPGLSSV